MRPTSSEYHWLSRQLHWWTVPLIITLFALGPVMIELPLNKLKQDLYAWHKWIGIIVLALVLIRLAWRVIKPAPAHHAPMVPPLFHFAAKAGHAALYILLIAVPLIGWVRSSTAGYQVVLFELIPLPDLLAKDEAISKTLEFAHMLGAYSLAALLAGHIGAVILHHRFWQDHVLKRMQPTGLHVLLVAGFALGGAAFAANYLLINPPAVETAELAKDKQANEIKETAKTEPPPAPGEWQVLQEQSELAFTATQKGSKTTGTFKEIGLSRLSFDPDAPEAAEVEVSIAIASLSLGNTMIDNTLISSAWFDAENHPKATYKASNFKALSNNQYRLNGTLTIKGQSHPLELILEIKKSSDQNKGGEIITANGSTTINRMDYKIGEGEWAAPEMLDHQVGLSIKVTAIKGQ